MKHFLSLLILISFINCSKDKDPIIIKYTISVSVSDGGSVDNTGGSYDENSSVVITAEPNEGYEFTEWSGDVSGNTNPLTVIMTGDKTITATFSRIQYTLNVGFVGQGSVSQEVTNTAKTEEEYNSGDVVHLTATPETGWLFISWSGSSTATTNEIDITIDGTKSVTATFEEQISNVLQDGVFLGVGKWKIRKNFGSGKSLSVDCEIAETIFRTDGTFTFYFPATEVSTEEVISGSYVVSKVQEQNYSIFLNTGGTYFGTINELSLTNNLIAFTFTSEIYSSSGCITSITGKKDTTYNETSDPITGTVTFTNVDTTAPVITLIGSTIIQLSVGDTFTDPGATATDAVDGDLTASITSTSTVDTSVVGFYAVLYSVTDAAGNAASIYREINVTAAATSYNILVVASSNSDYTLTGSDRSGTVDGYDAPITINAGDTLNFDVNAPGHPFYIKTAQEPGTGYQASNVTNNGTTGGVVSWTPTTTGTYYYQCSVHSGMHGTITVQ